MMHLYLSLLGKARMRKRKAHKGFTLAELLIALAILGVIATFTIPKVLQAGTSSQNTAIAKEAASMVSGAFSAYQLNNTIVSGNKGSDLTQYMNYVAVATTGTLSSSTTGTALDTCSSTFVCLKLHNGGILQYDTGQTFGGTGTTNAIYFNLDPDGTGSAGRATFVQYYNGRFTTLQQKDTGTVTAGVTMGAQSTDPSYIQNWN